MNIACSDGNCVFKTTKGGMGTNGGCHCLDDVRGGTPRVEMRKKIRTLVSEIQEDQGEIESLAVTITIARKDAQDLIAVASQQEQVIDNLEKQIAHLTKDAAFAESDRQEAIKYRTALVTIESIFRESSAHGLDEPRVRRLLDAALRLQNGVL